MEAIVLSRRDFREFDQIISFYTKDKGKIELLARGVKKMQSKNSAHLEPFSYVHIEMVKGKEIDHLTRVIPINFFANIRQKIDKSLASGFISFFLEKITEVQESDKRIFDLFLSWLKFVDRVESFRPILIDGFIIILFSYLGFKPVLEKCVVCGDGFNKLVKEDLSRLNNKKLGFYFAGGGIICVSCRDKKEYVGEEIVDCGLKEISDMQVLLKGDWQIISNFNLEKEEKKVLHKLVYEFVMFHSEKKMGDWGLIM